MAEPLIWLPLNGDFRNNGLLNATITPQGSPTLDNNGKCGKCCKYANTYITNLGNLYDCPMTITFWMRTDATTNWQKILMFEDQDLAQFHGIYVADSARIKYEYTPSVNMYNSVIAEWHHYAFVITSGHSLGYRDGELIGSSTETIAPKIIGRLKLGEAASVYLNDFRIYDTALSDYEIKLLSQGLILHYPLDRNGLGGENLITNSFPSGSGTLWNVTGTNWTRAFVTNDFSPSGYVCRATYNGTGTAGGGAHRGPVIAKADFENGATYTLSGWMRANQICNVTFKNELMNIGSGNITVTPEWKFYSVTATVDTSKTYSSDVMYRASNVTNGCWQEACMIKLEKGSKATPWCPADSELSDLITVYDTSGFGNNGTATNITYDGDTARYTASSVFNGTDSAITLTGIDLSSILNNDFTLSFWIKPQGENGGRSVYFGAFNLTSLNIEKHDNNKFRFWWNNSPDLFFSESITDGSWTHICVTKQGATTVTLYINGKLSEQKTGLSLESKTFGTTWRIGRDSRTNDGTQYHGDMSDFRLYCTALSAEQIKDLFEASAKVNRDGTMYVYSYVEV